MRIHYRPYIRTDCTEIWVLYEQEVSASVVNWIYVYTALLRTQGVYFIHFNPAQNQRGVLNSKNVHIPNLYLKPILRK